MIYYYLLFLFPTLFIFIEDKISNSLKKLISILILFYIIIFTGLRDEVGGDWYVYKNYYEFFNQSLNIDIGFYYLIIITKYFGFNFYFFNFLIAIFFCLCTYIFCYKQKHFFLSISVLIPYYFIIISMGYIRQAIAMSFVILVISNINNKKLIPLHILFILFAFSFHKTAIIFLSIVMYQIITLYREFIFKYFFLIILIILNVFFVFIYYDKLSVLIQNYFYDVSAQSSGSKYRLILLLIPSISYILLSKYFSSYRDNKFWILFNISFILISSTYFISTVIADRISLYFYSCQIIFFNRFVDLFTKYNIYLIKIIIILYSFIILFIWLNFAVNRSAWLPYSFFY